MKSPLEIKDKTKQTEGLKIAPFRQHIRKTVPHKHNNYFEIIYLTAGSGEHTIDTKAYEIKPPIIFNIRKEQVHFWDIKTKPEGFVLIIKKSFIEGTLDQDIKRLIAELSAYTCLFPKDNTAVEIFHLLLSENQRDQGSNKPVIEGLLKALLGKLREAATADSNKLGTNSIYQKFIELLSKENKLTNKVMYYAEILNTTPQNLNAICRKEGGSSASETIAEHIIRDAKRLLSYTDFTVSEISTRLEFKDHSHFTKYFKRQVGETPIGYRKSNS
ncbi:AraC family transcriptional regulator [Crocinitomix catalasitica]|uniref:AraC family transcriptional regulator n=1 Tax=Crocinitomix catalasitica TaxID=184607 RepID=UPI0004822E8F|nr:helix-turn-helix transcriptional regulator [Crocinitomix catalasitica]